MGQPDRVTSSRKKRGGIEIVLGNGSKKNIYPISITEFGSEDSKEGDFTAWGWLKHLRHKTWWSPSLESEYKREVKKYL